MAAEMILVFAPTVLYSQVHKPWPSVPLLLEQFTTQPKCKPNQVATRPFIPSKLYCGHRKPVFTEPSRTRQGGSPSCVVAGFLLR